MLTEQFSPQDSISDLFESKLSKIYKEDDVDMDNNTDSEIEEEDMEFSTQASSQKSIPNIKVTPQVTPLDDEFRTNMQLIKLMGKQLDSSLSKNKLMMRFIMRKHKITAYMRAQMIDWMIQVIYILREPSPTFFRAVSIMD